MIKGLAASGALGADARSAADLDQALGMLGMMGPMIFQGLTSESSTAVSIDEPNYVIGAASLLVGSEQPASDGGDERRSAADELPSGQSLVEFSTMVVNSEIGVEQTIEAPADAQIVPC